MKEMAQLLWVLLKEESLFLDPSSIVSVSTQV